MKLSESPPNIETLFGLVERFSPTGSEAEVVDWLTNHMTNIGYTKSYVDKAGNAIGIYGSGSHQLVLLGHIDTVPGAIHVRLEDGALFGRGTVDAKGPLAAFVDAISLVGEIPDWQFIVVGAVDEEGESTGARSIVEDFKPDFCIVGEPNQWDRFAIGYKGSAQTLISSRRPIVHTARLEETSCEILANHWRIIQDWSTTYNQSYKKLFEQIQPSLLAWESGKNGFEQWANISISTRLPPQVDPDEWLKILNTLVVGSNITPLGFPLASFQGNKNSALVRAFLNAIRTHGGKPVFVYKSGTSDANVVCKTWHCPIVVYGPGNSDLDHTAHEHIRIEDFQKAVMVLVDVIHRLIE